MSNLNTVALLMRDDIVTVHCAFNSDADKEYTYVCSKHVAEHLKLGDKVVVMGNKQNMQIVEVRQIDEDCDVDIHTNWDYAWIIQRISIEHYENNKAETDSMVKTLKKRQRETVRRQALESMGITGTAQLK